MNVPLDLDGTTKPFALDVEEERVKMIKLRPNDSEQLRFKLHAFGEDLKLVLYRNVQLATPQAQVIYRHNARTVSRERVDEYYTGYIQSRTGSSLAVKLNNGSLVGNQITFKKRQPITLHYLPYIL
jgi:hypothetical protein